MFGEIFGELGLEIVYLPGSLSCAREMGKSLSECRS